MRETDLTIEETRFYDGALAVRLPLPECVTLGYGQYLLAASPGDLLPVALFPQSTQRGVFLSTPEAPPHWKAGDVLRVRGPLGVAFEFPPGARRLVCLAARRIGHAMLPIISAALGQRCSVVMCSDTPPAGLPGQVEVQPGLYLPELIAWADLMLLDLSISQIGEFKTKFMNTPKQLPIYAFIHVSMPCGSQSACGLCAVQTTNGIKLACQDGPIFDWHTLEA